MALKREVLGEPAASSLLLVSGDLSEMNLMEPGEVWKFVLRFKLLRDIHDSSLYLPQSLIVAFPGPHLRQRDRNTDTCREERTTAKTGQEKTHGTKKFQGEE